MASLEKNSLLPPSATSAEQAIEQSTASLEKVPLPTKEMWSPESCPEHLLPWLAWALSVDNWDSDWDVAIKRSVIRESIQVHRKKGTRHAVELALSALGTRIDLSEWFEDNGRPHTFTLTALANNAARRSNGEVILDEALYEEVRRNVDSTKPARSHYELRVGASFNTDLKAAVAIKGGNVIRERTKVQEQSITNLVGNSIATSAQATSFLKLTMELNNT